ncbi:HAD family hydrolase [Candidatus Woesearchaeota archaeon]|nr:HAD family hydrolase [Candidatus Woesearchaeota archaeon]
MKDIIIFDYDGVIADSFDVVLEIFNSICEKYGINKQEKHELREMYKQNFFESMKQKGMKEENMNEFDRDYKKTAKIKEHKIILFDGIKEIINKLSEKYNLFIVTSNFKKIVKNDLKRFNINVIKDVIGGDEEQSKTKKIKSIKEKYKNSKTYFITDTIGDIKESKKADVFTIAVSWGYHNKEMLKKENPDFIVNSPEELLKLFN